MRLTRRGKGSIARRFPRPAGANPTLRPQFHGFRVGVLRRSTRGYIPAPLRGEMTESVMRFAFISLLLLAMGVVAHAQDKAKLAPLEAKQEKIGTRITVFSRTPPISRSR